MLASSAEGVFLCTAMRDPHPSGGDSLPKSFRRRSSIQKIIHMCNQSYQVFPHVFLWVQVHVDARKALALLRSFWALRCGVYLSLALLSAELLYVLRAALSLLGPSGSAFFLACIGLLSLIALEAFDVALAARKKLRGTFFVNKKKKIA